MKKSFIAILLIIALVATAAFCLTACDMMNGGGNGGDGGGNGGNSGGDGGGDHYEHDFGDWEIVVHPTCNDPGRQERYCACGEVDEEIISPLGHNYAAAVTEPTCTEGGYTTYTCSREGCGYSYVSDRVPKLGHKYVDGVCERCGQPIAESEGLDFTLNAAGTAYKVTGYNGTDEEIVILATHEGKPVVAIGENAFSYKESVRSVLLPESIKTIERYAFYGSRVTEITIPASVETIESYAFDSSIVKTITFAENSSLEAIGNYAFDDCLDLTEIAIPEGVKTLGEGAFSYCAKLTSVSLPSTLTKLGSKIVANCKALETLTVAAGNPVYSSKGNCIIETATKKVVVGCNASVIPADGSATTIGDYAFYGCTEITEFIIPSAIKAIEYYALPEKTSVLVYNVYEGGNYFGNEENPYMVLVSVVDAESESLVLADDVKIIAPRAFANTSVPSVTIPAGMETIGDYAFQYSALTEIEIPSSVKSIGKYAFSGNRQLAEISFAADSAIESIGEGAFWECTSLETISVPASVTSVGKEAFRNCPIKTATLPAVAISAITSKSALEEVTINGGVIGTEAFESLSNLTRVRILSGVTEIGTEAFAYCRKLTSVEIGADVRKIDNAAFSNCVVLETVTFASGSKIEEFGDSVFYSCEALTFNEEEDAYYLGSEDNEKLILVKPKDDSATEFAVDENTKVIFNEAFEYMYEMTSVTLPAGLRAIERLAFGYCSALTELTLPENLTFIGREAFYQSGLESIEIPAGVKTINDRTFQNSQQLRTVTFAEGSALESIDYRAFNSCSTLTNVNIPSTLTTVGAGAFGDCPWLNYNEYKNGYYLGNENDPFIIFVKPKNKAAIEDTFELHSTTKVIHAGAFYDCSTLTSIVIPASVTDIGSGAFQGCGSLRSVTLPEGLTTINAAVFNNTALRTVTIPAAVTVIGSSAFDGCKELAIVTFAEGSALERIEMSAFQHCEALSRFVMPSGLQYIGQDAFVNCKSLTSLDFPATFNEMDLSAGYNPFAYCSGLESITVAEGNEKYFAEGNCLIERSNPAYNPSYGLILGCKNSVIPENANITYIVGGAFRGRTGLTKIVIPYGVRSIANNAFEDCHDLVSIELPGTLESIYNYAFDGCYKLIEICNKARYMSLEKGSSDKGEVAYYARNIYTDTEGESKLSEDEDGYLLYTDGEDVVLVAYYGEETELVLPEGVTEILAYAFAQSEIESAQIPASVKKIGKRAFSECAYLKTVTFAEDSELTELADGAFVACAELTAIEIPAGVAHVEINALTDCTKLVSVTITAGTVFDGWSMVRATALAEICFNGTTDEWLATANGESWNAYTGNYTVICSDGTVSKTGVVTPLA